jgi:ubiquinone/menaquinone biosynthesis C-methylase UbiE
MVERNNLNDQADKIHKQNWKEDGYNRERIDKCDKLLEGELILDIGAADGQIASYLSKSHGRKIIALEKTTRWLTIHGEATVPFVFSDIYQLPFANNTFDSIFIGEVVEHLYDPKEAVLEALRVLKTGGVIVGTTPNFAFWKKRLSYLKGQFAECPSSPLNHEHIRFFNVNYLRGLLSDARMKDIEIHGIWPNLSLEQNYIKPLKNILASRHPELFSYILLFKGRK